MGMAVCLTTQFGVYCIAIAMGGGLILNIDIDIVLVLKVT
jgi:hypothetical protein